ncbi:GNAT family N-acetyltransferase [Paenibacillus sacheonensis]|uniref:GNAT family N-acetyltransferase n=1 Tax=Paenibacillus sacheonensis TaxID=742054 RepID=A0A7X4YQ19_9BACL|nr:GNAT family N-acetyltransferase [Paenibacillus sacheonensis]MBM7565481.1 RimJ/RimL family protein N-acetyltransferase [Paenibacillus sacheonensis]NBC69591.1 GNAT family N-acetyltransferase [Paenibacillus sacheonensis]
MQGTFQTDRLLLRPFNPQDAVEVQQLAGEYEVARTTLSLPHPYPDGAAESWIAFRTDAARHGHGYTFAITALAENQLMGCVSLNLTSEHKRAEIGYWLGSRYWGNGYATEAAGRIVRFGFEELHLNRIVGAAMTKNPASSAVLRKIGMHYEGCFKQHIRKWNVYEDVDYYGLTSADFLTL